MYQFQSEPNLIIVGTEFKIRVTTYVQDERVRVQETAFGREGQSCAWYFVPKTERKRLEKMGVRFVEEV